MFALCKIYTKSERERRERESEREREREKGGDLQCMKQELSTQEKRGSTTTIDQDEIRRRRLAALSR